MNPYEPTICPRRARPQQRLQWNIDDLPIVFWFIAIGCSSLNVMLQSVYHYRQTTLGMVVVNVIPLVLALTAWCFVFRLRHRYDRLAGFRTVATAPFILAGLMATIMLVLEHHYRHTVIVDAMGGSSRYWRWIAHTCFFWTTPSLYCMYLCVRTLATSLLKTRFVASTRTQLDSQALQD